MSNWKANLGVQPEIIRGNGWQPIETAPKDGTLFIGYAVIAIVDGDPEAMVEGARWQDGRYRFRNPRAPDPTHWIQLPEPPQ